ncbi:hypothetical protein, partial [uncultured Brevundimonas sp.]|uniref:hypothetical protein n=1 Tax=uncultured Brevundimonas sp. TaxID=213418 RepID=UPI0025FE8237
KRQPSCCGQPPSPPFGGGNFGVNVNVNVNGNANGNANANSNANSNAGRGFIGARSGGGFYGGGGGGSAYVTVDQPYPTTINGLNVEGGMARRMERVAFEARRRVEKRVVIQAFCIDARNVPHPASQVRPGRDVGLDYEGELYRCLAGTYLQATIADYTGEIDFNHGETMRCERGQALWFGNGGTVECRTQKQERDCNERSLLRRYGAGVKILTMFREETYTDYREEWVEEAAAMVSGATMTLDGGVGGRVF